MLNILNRAERGRCLCCEGEIETQPTLTSAFLSERAWGGSVELSTTSRCSSCGFAFHGRGLSPQEVSNYYSGYRDGDYFLRRNHYEPFYTRSVHDSLEEQMGSALRREALASYLRLHGGLADQPNSSFDILDYGGGTGRLVTNLPGRKFVHDLSGESPVDGVIPVAASALRTSAFDLVVCAQMLEHATDPRATAEELLRLVKPGGHLYVEVPYDETWHDWSMDGRLRKILLSAAMKSRRFNTLLDIYGTAFRVKLKVLPPLAFVPVREHLNYFAPASLRALGTCIGGKVVDAARVELLGTTLLLKKYQS